MFTQRTRDRFGDPADASFHEFVLSEVPITQFM